MFGLAVDGAEREHETISSSLRQSSGVRTWLAACCGTPEADRSGGADREEVVKWKENSGPIRRVLIEVDPKAHSLKLYQVLLAINHDAAPERHWLNERTSPDFSNRVGASGS